VTDVRALYQAVIVDHDRAPRNHGPLVDATAHATVDNPLCGDVVTVHLRRDAADADAADAADAAAANADADRIGAIAFEARGCALCRAAASIMTGQVQGRRVDDARALAARFEAYVRGPAAAAAGTDDTVDADLGELTAFAGVRAFRSRQACATLPFRALLAALAAP
jgi:nitrogen fixation NifU-like protein